MRVGEERRGDVRIRTAVLVPGIRIRSGGWACIEHAVQSEQRTAASEREGAMAAGRVSKQPDEKKQPRAPAST
eukprot:6175138-Pleurochrysis_carterae.AAC.1